MSQTVDHSRADEEECFLENSTLDEEKFSVYYKVEPKVPLKNVPKRAFCEGQTVQPREGGILDIKSSRYTKVIKENLC